LLDYVAIYGLVLMPIGAVVLAEHWILPRLGVSRYRAERRGLAFNWNAAVVWAGTLLFCYALPVHLFFKWLPGYLVALAAYTALQAITSDKEAPVMAKAR
jgi:cytosine/uracil/thiamine/allantoin permease